MGPQPLTGDGSPPMQAHKAIRRRGAARWAATVWRREAPRGVSGAFARKGDNAPHWTLDIEASGRRIRGMPIGSRRGLRPVLLEAPPELPHALAQFAGDGGEPAGPEEQQGQEENEEQLLCTDPDHKRLPRENTKRPSTGAPDQPDAGGIPRIIEVADGKVLDVPAPPRLIPRANETANETVLPSCPPGHRLGRWPGGL